MEAQAAPVAAHRNASATSSRYGMLAHVQQTAMTLLY
jgi:hypothetical protein